MSILCKLLGSSTVLLLFVACATQAPTSLEPNDCDMSWLDESAVSSQKACELRVLAKRCAVADRCYVRCEARGGAATVSGGCEHICTGGGAAQTDEDIVRNGGLYATEESVACYNQAR